MRRWNGSRLVLLLILLTIAFALPGRGQAPAKPNDSFQTANELRREWVRRQLPKLVTDPDELAAFNARLDQLNSFEINELANACLEALSERRQLQFAALQEANRRARAIEEERARQADAIARAEQDRLAAWQRANSIYGPVPPYGFYGAYDPFGPPVFVYPPPVIGYFPVIAWLPQGVSLSASAVVSPDGRYVRMSTMPFFSNIGPVHTFNYVTGETRLVEDPRAPRDTPRRRVRQYDGFRTRSD